MFPQNRFIPAVLPSFFQLDSKKEKGLDKLVNLTNRLVGSWMTQPAWPIPSLDRALKTPDRPAHMIIPRRVTGCLPPPALSLWWGCHMETAQRWEVWKRMSQTAVQIWHHWQGARRGNGTQHLTKPPEREIKQIRETDQMFRSAGGRESKRLIEAAKSWAC